jgi:hypothetical protein
MDQELSIDTRIESVTLQGVGTVHVSVIDSNMHHTNILILVVAKAEFPPPPWRIFSIRSIY